MKRRDFSLSALGAAGAAVLPELSFAQGPTAELKSRLKAPTTWRLKSVFPPTWALAKLKSSSFFGTAARIATPLSLVSRLG